MLIFRALVVVAALVTGGSVVVAQQENIAAKRNAMMKQSGKAMYSIMGGMVRGKTPYDQAIVDAAFTDLDAAAKQYGTLFPASAMTTVPESNYMLATKAAENKADVEAKAAASAKIVAENKGKVTDLDGLKAAYTAMNKGCGGCHELYRVKK